MQASEAKSIANGRGSLGPQLSRRAGRALAAGRLGGGEASDRNPKRRARNVVEPDFVTKRHRGGIAAVLAANAELEVWARPAAALRRDLHQLADALAVDRHKRIDRQDAL